MFLKNETQKYSQISKFSDISSQYDLYNNSIIKELNHSFNFNLSSNYVIDEEIYLTFSQQALNNLKNGLIPILIKKFSKVKLKDVRIKKRIDFLGNIDLKLIDIYFSLNDIETSQLQININQNSQLLEIYLENASSQMLFNYEFLSNFYNITSNGFLNLNHIGIILKIQPTSINKIVDQNELKLFSIVITEFSFSDKIKFQMILQSDGKLEKIMKYVISQLGNIIRIAVNDAYNSQLLILANKFLIEFFSNQNGIRYFPNTLISMKYSLSKDVSFSNSCLQFLFNSEIIYNNKSNHFPPSTLPAQGPSENFVFILNSNIVNEGLYALHKQNLIKFNIGYHDVYNKTTNSSILNTTTFNHILEGMKKRYQNELPMNLTITTDEDVDPLLRISSNNLTTELGVDVGFLVNDNKGSTEQAFLAFLDAKIELFIEIINGKLQGKILSHQFGDFKIKEKVIDINETSLKLLFRILLPIVESYINDILKNGLVIPNIYGFSFKKSNFTIGEGYFKFDIFPLIE